ncbi:MAG TPA: type II toxin-antitoxin system RelE/ParE family toxin [Stellaceae bacterium]|nr:type II toxin-antitoxin system RelE/ParE family toxin [Stellaceae bacterium]
MNVEYSKRAVSDLRRIAAFYASSDDAAVGEKIAAAIRDLVSRIAEAPQWGRPVAQRPGVRVVLLVRYPYKIFYRVAGTTVRIIHIRHMSRRPWPSA